MLVVSDGESHCCLIVGSHLCSRRSQARVNTNLPNLLAFASLCSGGGVAVASAIALHGAFRIDPDKETEHFILTEQQEARQAVENMLEPQRSILLPLLDQAHAGQGVDPVLVAALTSIVASRRSE